MRVLWILVLAAALSMPALAADGSSAGVGPARGAAREACKADVASLCQGMQPGGGRIRACLKANKDKLSEGCRSAIAALIQARRAAKAASGQQSTMPMTSPAVP